MKWLLSVRLKSSEVDAAFGTEEDLERIAGHFRQVWPQVRILVRGDSSFGKDEIMAWCEATPGVDFVLGLAKNTRLEKKIARQMEKARKEREKTGEPAREFSSFYYKTLKSWTRERRVVAKAECTLKGDNPRFVVTSLQTEAGALRAGLLRPRRDGEPAQGAAAGAVFGSGIGAPDEGEPAADVVFGGGLLARLSHVR